jgi:hypothetical protein
MLRIHIISGTVKIQKNKMCEICKNNDSRTYTHSRSPHHRKLLIQLFKEKQIEYYQKYPLLR